MTSNRTVIFPAKDLESAKAVFGQLLGTEPVVDQPYYVQFEADGLEIGLDPHGHAHGPTVYWNVTDISARVHELVVAGATEVEPVKDVGGGLLVAVVKDANGNPIGLRQHP